MDFLWVWKKKLVKVERSFCITAADRGSPGIFSQTCEKLLKKSAQKQTENKLESLITRMTFGHKA